MRRSLIVLVMGVLLVAVVSVGFAQEITLRVATWDGPQGQIPIRETADEFERLHPGVKVQIEQVDDYKARLIVQLSGGVGPEVFMVGDWDYAELAARGLLANLTPYLERDGVDLGMYIPSILENHRYVDGNIYTLPKDFSTLGAYYNMDLLDQAGLAYPTNDWTWSEALEMMRKLTRRESDGTVSTWGVVVNPWWNAIAWSQAWGAGQEIISPDYRSVRGYLDAPETLAALRYFYDLQLAHEVNVPDAVRDGFGGEQGTFQSGAAAIAIWGNWGISGWRESNELRFGTVMPPNFGEHSTTFLMEAGWGLNPNIGDPEVRELAWELVKMLGTERGQYYMSRNFWAMPAIPQVASEVGIMQDPYYNAFVLAAFESMPTYWTKIPGFGNAFDQYFSRARELFLRGERDLQVAIGEQLDAMEKGLADAFSGALF